MHVLLYIECYTVIEYVRRPIKLDGKLQVGLLVSDYCHEGRNVCLLPTLGSAEKSNCAYTPK